LRPSEGREDASDKTSNSCPKACRRNRASVVGALQEPCACPLVPLSSVDPWEGIEPGERLIKNF
jgi:hypothetical protein